jgi:hypothetical protein
MNEHKELAALLLQEPDPWYADMPIASQIARL